MKSNLQLLHMTQMKLAVSTRLYRTYILLLLLYILFVGALHDTQRHRTIKKNKKIKINNKQQSLLQSRQT